MAFLAVLGGVGQAAAAVGSVERSATPSVGPIAYVNISAYPSLSFTPSAFTVAPGQAIHFVITQMSTFAHTFTLSSAVNYTNLSGYSQAQLDAFLHAHTPLVNISLGSTSGKKFYDNITAPLVTGKYEYICVIHWTTMDGLMTDATGGGGGGGGGGSPSLSPGLEVGLGVGLGLVVIAVALLLRRRRGSATDFSSGPDDRLKPPTRGSRHQSGRR